MKALYRVLPAVIALAFLVSCGDDKPQGAIEARSMEEALSLAAENNSFVVIEFWMDG